MAQNIETAVSGDTLVIRINLKGAKVPSSTGKSDKLASTNGNIDVPGVPGLKLGVNAYFPK